MYVYTLKTSSVHRDLECSRAVRLPVEPQRCRERAVTYEQLSMEN